MPFTPGTQPNPYLEDPQRDLVTNTGLALSESQHQLLQSEKLASVGQLADLNANLKTA